MQEDFLHFVWRTRRFDWQNLQTTEGAPVEILHFGDYNTDAGPDFLNARIRIGETLWAGQVEMHLRASDWEKHKHSTDAAYANVILHVVLEEDAVVRRANGKRIPCVELQKHIPAALSKKYLKLLDGEYWIPCQHQFYQVAEITRNLWLDRLLVERLERKTALITAALQQNQNNWEETFYQLLARNFGTKVNADPFTWLAESLPLSMLGKHKNDRFQTEALLFGQAGLLEADLDESYPKRLQKEYRFLQKKYQLTPIPKVSWKFSRLRPANLPTLRIAQLAQLLFQSSHLFSKILDVQAVEEIESLFDIQLEGYWLTHYTFGKSSKKRQKTLGQQTIHLLIINTIAPILFLYGKWKSEQRYQDRAFQLLENLPPETNRIIYGWKALGVAPDSAYQTQALLQLKNEYCNAKRCLECAIGNAVLK